MKVGNSVYYVSAYKYSLGQEQFYHASKWVLSMLSLPISNAAVERVFSLVSIVKDTLRNKICIDTYDAILRIRCS